ncbi:MAG: hypothetical protein ACYS0D_10355 [Planctomycetota bacterium]|jgi:hypothetical protein
MTNERKQALRIFAAMKKRAAEGEPRGVGQRFFEGTMTGAGLGSGVLGIPMALAGAYHGFKRSKGQDLKERLKSALVTALQAGALGAGTGAAVGGGLHGISSALLGSRKQAPTY